ncbi:MAG: efflux RND transporter periplasmic adaptor subunit [Verrucomicrobiae bacterium]|nr:efflux RND transporter periplasmic adaptor subunit [Verrucomicrobiae bacterium]
MGISNLRTGGRSNTMKHARRRWLSFAVAGLLVCGLVLGLWPEPVPVETAVVSRGFLRSTINEEGRTRVRHRYVVAAPVSGQLRRITLRPGDQVKAGRTVLAVIEPAVPVPLDLRARAAAEARRTAAVAALEKARVIHEFMEAELMRFERLFKEGAVSVQEFDAAKTRFEQSARDVALAEGNLRQAEAELAEFSLERSGARNPVRNSPVEVFAPVDGCVLRVFEESERVVVAGTPLLEVGDLKDLEVVIEVLSRDGAGITPGTLVLLEQWGGGKPLEARVRLVEPSAFTKISALGVEEQRVNVVADIVTPHEQRIGLGDGYRVEAKIVVWEGNDVVKVPTGALFRRGIQWNVFVVVNGRAEMRTVRAGRTSGAETQVLEGLREGEVVIVYPGDRVRPGVRVRRIEI